MDKFWGFMPDSLDWADALYEHRRCAAIKLASDENSCPPPGQPSYPELRLRCKSGLVTTVPGIDMEKHSDSRSGVLDARGAGTDLSMRIGSHHLARNPSNTSIRVSP